MWVDHVQTSILKLATSQSTINSPSIVQMTSNLAQKGAQSHVWNDVICSMPCQFGFFSRKSCKKLKFRVPFVKLMHVYIYQKSSLASYVKKGMVWWHQNTPFEQT